MVKTNQNYITSGEITGVTWSRHLDIGGNKLDLPLLQQESLYQISSKWEKN